MLYRDAIPVKRGRDIVLRESGHPGRGICQIAPRRVLELKMPLRDGSMLARFTRVHELLHAKHTKYRPSPTAADQAHEDCLNHSVRWPPDKGLTRCMHAAHLASLRHLLHAPILEDRNHVITLILSAVAASTHSVTWQRARRYSRAIERVLQRYGWLEHIRLFDVAAVPHEKDALARFERLFTLLGNPPENDWSVSSRAGGSEPSKIERMNIVEPPRPIACDRGLNDVTEYRRAGTRIDMRRAVTETILPLGRPVCVTREVQAGFSGTVLIDASSSMRWDEDSLIALCSHAPGALVAYYSGHHGRGELVIAARDGRRISQIVYKHGGNEIDFPALTWLLRQRPPHMLITDGVFCGGYRPQDARILADRCDLIIPDVRSALEWAQKGGRI